VTAIGYATIDVAATCSVALPIDPGYFSAEILFDNVLIGDYQDVNQSTTAGNYAGGNPLVHIRAIPEGGPAGSLVATNLPFTFYDRYQGGALTSTARTVDRRQPLPSAFAAWTRCRAGLARVAVVLAAAPAMEMVSASCWSATKAPSTDSRCASCRTPTRPWTRSRIRRSRPGAGSTGSTAAASGAG